MTELVDWPEAGSPKDRAYFRVRTRLPLRCEPLDERDRKTLDAEILGTIDPPPVELDPGLGAWLDTIERKLDRVLHLLDADTDPILGANGETDMLLSGSGMSFEAAGPLPVDSHVVLHFEIPAERARQVRCIAKVAHCTPGADGRGAMLGVAFETIRAEDVDAVVAYTVSVQRQQIRAHREGGAAE